MGPFRALSPAPTHCVPVAPAPTSCRQTSSCVPWGPVTETSALEPPAPSAGFAGPAPGTVRPSGAAGASGRVVPWAGPGQLPLRQCGAVSSARARCGPRAQAGGRLAWPGPTRRVTAGCPFPVGAPASASVKGGAAPLCGRRENAVRANPLPAGPALGPPCPTRVASEGLTVLGSPGTLPTCPAVQRGVCSLQASPSPSPGGALGTLWTCPAQRHLALRRHLWNGAGKALSACGAALPGPGTGSRTGRPGGHAVAVTLSGRRAALELPRWPTARWPALQSRRRPGSQTGLPRPPRARSARRGLLSSAWECAVCQPFHVVIPQNPASLGFGRTETRVASRRGASQGTGPRAERAHVPGAAVSRPEASGGGTAPVSGTLGTWHGGEVLRGGEARVRNATRRGGRGAGEGRGQAEPPAAASVRPQRAPCILRPAPAGPHRSPPDACEQHLHAPRAEAESLKAHPPAFWKLPSRGLAGQRPRSAHRCGPSRGGD